MSTGLLKHYLNYGDDADKPATMVGTALESVLCLYWAEDTEKMYWWNWTVPGWVQVLGVGEVPTDGVKYVRLDGAWESAPIQDDAPEDGTNYGRKDGAWVGIAEFPEAPEDGNNYARKDGGWVSFTTLSTEQVQDLVATMATEGSGINLTYDDVAGTLTIECTITQYTNAMADARIAAAHLGDLADVDVASPTDGQVLTFDDSDNQWKPATPAAGTGDVEEAPEDGQLYARKDGAWESFEPGEGGGGGTGGTFLGARVRLDADYARAGGSEQLLLAPTSVVEFDEGSWWDSGLQGFVVPAGVEYVVFEAQRSGGTTGLRLYKNTTLLALSGDVSQGFLHGSTGPVPCAEGDVFYPKVYGSSGYTLEADEPSFTWAAIHAVSGVGAGSGGGTPKTEWEYWRIECFDSYSNAFCAVAIEMRETVGGANSATGGTAITNDSAFGAAADAFDGNSGTFWGANPGDSTYIGYHFAAPIEIKEIGWTPRSGSEASQTPSGFVVSASDDGVAWQQIWRGNFDTPVASTQQLRANTLPAPVSGGGGSSYGAPTIVQFKAGRNQINSAVDIILDATPTPGNTLVLIISSASGSNSKNPFNFIPLMIARPNPGDSGSGGSDYDHRWLGQQYQGVYASYMPVIAGDSATINLPAGTNGGSEYRNYIIYEIEGADTLEANWSGRAGQVGLQYIMRTPKFMHGNDNGLYLIHAEQDDTPALAFTSGQGITQDYVHTSSGNHVAVSGHTSTLGVTVSVDTATDPAFEMAVMGIVAIHRRT